MRKASSHDPTRQHSLTDWLAEAEATNEARRVARDTAHLPETLAEGIAAYRRLLDRHHAAVLSGDEVAADQQRSEADLLALKLNGGNRGYLADDKAPGCILQRRTAARAGRVPLWGQVGCFTLELGAMRVRIETQGLYGVCGYASFDAHAVDRGRPFLSPTGYRSFIGYGPGTAVGVTVDAYAGRAVEEHVARELRGRLLPIDPQYRTREG